MLLVGVFGPNDQARPVSVVGLSTALSLQNISAGAAAW